MSAIHMPPTFIAAVCHKYEFFVFKTNLCGNINTTLLPIVESSRLAKSCSRISEDCTPR